MEEFLEKNFKKLLFGFIAAAVVVVVYGVSNHLTTSRNAEAAAAFASAKTAEDYDLVVSRHGGTPAAGNALLAKADLLWEENKKDSSVEALQQFLRDHSDHAFVAQARLGLGSKLDSLGKRAEAKTAFEKVIADHAGTDEAALAQLRLGDLLWAEGKEDEAKAMYESLPARHAKASSELLDQGEARLNWISAKLPVKEVDGPPKPKSAAPAPGAPQIQIGSPLTVPGQPAPAAPKAATPAAPKAATPAAPKAPAPKAATPAAPKAETSAAPKAPAPKAATPATPKAETPAAPKAAVPTPAPAAPAPKAEAPKAPEAPATPAPKAP